MRRKRRKDGLVDKVLYTQFIYIMPSDNLSSMLAESLIPEGQIWENVMTSENIDDVRNLLIDKYIFDPKNTKKKAAE